MGHPPGKLTPQARDRLIAAIAGWRVAQEEREAAIVAALKSGASLRQVSEVTGISTSRVKQIGNAGGWSAADWHAARAREQAEREDWNARIEAAAEKLRQRKKQ